MLMAAQSLRAWPIDANRRQNFLLFAVRVSIWKPRPESGVSMW